MKRHWVRRVLRILRHDLTLLVLVLAFLAVSAGVLMAARHDPSALSLYTGLLAEEPAVPAPPEEELAVFEVPWWWAAALEKAEGTALHITRGRIDAGESVASSLRRQGIGPAVTALVASELSPIFDFRRAQPGHRYRLVQDQEGEVVEFHYRISMTDSYVLRRDGDGWSAAREEARLRPQVARIAGIVDSSLHDAIVALGEEGQLANDFSGIFAWDLDFSRSVQSGDEFRVLYERLYLDDEDEGEVYVGPGRILAARFEGAAGEYSALYFEPAAGRGGYYRPDGSSVQRQFLQAPLRYSRISSSFTSARRHPILKITRPHHGIDYAAPVGTPLWAVADGKVIYRGWAGGFGNLVKIRHSNGYISYYAHLSRFARGLSVGSTVQQKQVIGYVGKSGLATGPHVCFRIAKDGRFVNPARLQTPAGAPVPADQQHIFETTRNILLTELDGGPLVSVGEAL
jgi:murein DD-endopeptidase MepM/ murein hydrolase activator NlpD